MLGTISLIIIIFIIAFLIGAAGMARYKRPNQPIVKVPTKETLYSDHVIHVASRIYCNYNESKIIRLGAGPKLKKDRYGEALQEALNLVGAAYRYFDVLDSEEKVKPKMPGIVQKIDTKDIKIN